MTAGRRSFLENNKQFSNIHLRHRSVSLTTFSEYSILNTINVSISQVIGSKTQNCYGCFLFSTFLEHPCANTFNRRRLCCLCFVLLTLDQQSDYGKSRGEAAIKTVTSRINQKRAGMLPRCSRRCIFSLQITFFVMYVA